MEKILNIDPSKYNTFISLLIRLVQFITKVYLKFYDDAGFARAGGLAFNTLLAAVPFIALVIALLNAFGALDSIENQVMDFILNLLIPTKQGQATDLIKTFLENSNKLGVIGLIFFAVTSIILLNTISVNLNAVWGSSTKNNFMKKFTTYTSVIIFGTLFLAASTTITSRFNFFKIEEIAIVKLALLKFSPYIFNFLVILLVISTVPSGKIKLRYLFFVSALGSIFWEVLKFTFFNVSSSFIRMSVIYGAIAIIPIFLFWIYIIWIIIIFTLETAWVMQHKEKIRNLKTKNRLPGEEFYFYFLLFMSIAEDFYNGNPIPTSEMLSTRFSVSVNEIEKTLNFLASCNFIVKAGKKGLGWLPAKSLSIITAKEILYAIIGKHERLTEDIEYNYNFLKSFTNAGFTSIGNCTISEILEKKRTPSKMSSKKP